MAGYHSAGRLLIAFAALCSLARGSTSTTTTTTSAASTTETATAEPRICQKGGTGLFMPAQYEHDWDTGLRACIYLAFLTWCFLGVMVVSDVFGAGIDKITSSKRRRWNAEANRYQTELVWNPTIANLSLCALGSSAPEILLNVIEVSKNSFFAGSLGPSTIVGSAAFNLFVIIAVCIVSIPEGEVRYIDQMQVYVVTASFSLFAYFWLIVILVWSTPDVVELWEAILTFLFFPMLLLIAYAADRGMFPGTSPVDHSRQVQGMTVEELAMRKAQLHKEYGDNITEDQILRVLEVEGQARSFTSSKNDARRRLMGGRATVQQTRPSGLQRALTTVVPSFGSKKVVPIVIEEEVIPDENKATIEFKMIKVAILESAGTVTCAVVREGGINHAVTVDYSSEDGTAKETRDYDKVQGTLTFEKGETEKTITVKIIDDVAFEEDEEFYINLFNPKAIITEPSPPPNESGNAQNKPVCVLGTSKRTTVVIIDDDLPGVMCFEKDSVVVAEPQNDEDITIKVTRKNGSAGSIGCSYTTENGTAVAGVDYEETSGKLTFAEGEMTKTIIVKVKAKGRYDRTEMFRIILTEHPDVPGHFDEKADGAPDMCILTIVIETDKESKKQVDRIMSSLQTAWEKSKVGNANWADQFKNALYVMGGEDDNDDGEGEPAKPGVTDWIMHILTVPWKLLFALIPPTDYCGGWACFGCSLIMIGGLTALIGDLASLFGCCADMPDEVSAITVVALGTSLPDTFVSMSLASQSKHADDSVGNVTGSNSVNVFLGLGLPWMMASIFWTANGQSEKWRETYAGDQNTDWYKTQLCNDGCFVVKAGSLSFSVAVYTICACIAICILYVRRTSFGGELGGPKGPAWVTAGALVLLWATYISLSTWNATK